MRQRENHSWFSAVKVSLIVLVVAVLAVTGVVLYQHHKPNSAKSSAATNQTQATTQPQSTASVQPAQATAHYLDIKEWGVHMTLDSTTASMYYYIKPDLPGVAYLSLKSISNIAPNCAADKFSLGAIVRQTPAEQQSAPDAKYSIKGTTHIGSYWYGFSIPQAGCFNSTKEAAVQKALPGFNIGKISQAFNTLAAD